MPQHCAAYDCKNRRTAQSRQQGITFHRFPKEQNRRKKWEVALRRKYFRATDESVLCCEHFKPEDFDRTGQTVRLRSDVIPSVFNFPAHLQTKKVKAARTSATSRRAEESLPVDLCQDAPVEPEESMPVDLCQDAPVEPEESLPVDLLSLCPDALDGPEPSPKPRPKRANISGVEKDHTFALPSCPVALKKRLIQATDNVITLEREMSNARKRELRARSHMTYAAIYRLVTSTLSREKSAAK
ncbi:THAP domain-containing protein 2-like [Myripristis murdjan]|uniref:THAP domain-containing protein 2-like n=1 Tax=Myripristis murdjan TaxID=586833 RepID=UPI001175E612|nr:THAP domain-containing protein 2-like [Myripristis murdjan]